MNPLYVALAADGISFAGDTLKEPIRIAFARIASMDGSRRLALLSTIASHAEIRLTKVARAVPNPAPELIAVLPGPLRTFLSTLNGQAKTAAQQLLKDSLEIRQNLSGDVREQLIDQCDAVLAVSGHKDASRDGSHFRQILEGTQRRKKPLVVIRPGVTGGGDGKKTDTAPSGGALSIAFQNFPQLSQVYWLIQAHDRLENLLAEENAVRGNLENKRDWLSARLQWTFPQAKAIVVIDCIESFRSKPNKHVLRVEVFGEGELNGKSDPAAFIVKVADGAELDKEWRGYRSCWRRSNNRGRVLMTLRPGKQVGHRPGQYDTLVYEDAYQTLRAAEVVSLEQAVLECYQRGVPLTESLDAVTGQVFDELADNFYRRSYICAARNEGPHRLLKEYLADSCSAWIEGDASHCRETVLDHLPAAVREFIDPRDYLNRVLETTRFIPELLFGCAHGDLHGRNVLVGVVDGSARWPAVFDFEDMGNRNLVGWDFVKLEIELKIRALSSLYQGDEVKFIQGVYTFEQQLAAQTVKANNFPSWPALEKRNDPEGRLLYLLYAIRRSAKKCLGALRHRERRWLHEYHFLLLCYGFYAGKFGNYSSAEAKCAYICAGFAATQFAWGVGREDNAVANSIAAAKEAIKANNSAARPDCTWTPASYRIELALAREFCRSMKPEFMQQGITLLKSLIKQYPYIQDLRHELILACVELYAATNDRSHFDRAMEALTELERLFKGEHEETLSRRGRILKDAGDKAYGIDVERAKALYRQAIDYYRRAYNLQKHYYPGINAATLTLLVDQLPDSSATLAREIVDRLEQEKPWPKDDYVWRCATQGEAQLLLGDAKSALESYRAAANSPDCQMQNRESMYKQIARIFRRLKTSDANLDEFGRVLGIHLAKPHSNKHRRTANRATARRRK
jgi:hypothetical protein